MPGAIIDAPAAVAVVPAAVAKIAGAVIGVPATVAKKVKAPVAKKAKVTKKSAPVMADVAAPAEVVLAPVPVAKSKASEKKVLGHFHPSRVVVEILGREMGDWATLVRSTMTTAAKCWQATCW